MGVFDKFNFSEEKSPQGDAAEEEVAAANEVDVDRGFVTENSDQLQRRLGNRQIQLLAIGGSIGMSRHIY